MYLFLNPTTSLAGLIGLGILIFGTAATVILRGSDEVGKNAESTQTVLSISPQTPTESVLVDRVAMPSDGWVVARGIEGDQLGQVIEISRYLAAGIHESVVVPLGDFYDGEEVIVMLYEDNGDGIFNDLDLPTLNAEGRMTAVYARTGEPLPATITAVSDSSMVHSMPGMAGMARIRYTNEGFIPSTIEVAPGTMVEFVNESDQDMWVASDMHPTHERLPTFDQFRPYKPGGMYRYTFDEAGTWPYHDHLRPTDIGEIVVQ